MQAGQDQNISALKNRERNPVVAMIAEHQNSPAFEASLPQAAAYALGSDLFGGDMQCRRRTT
jgi:hypothetical protein